MLYSIIYKGIPDTDKTDNLTCEIINDNFICENDCFSNNRTYVYFILLEKTVVYVKNTWVLGNTKFISHVEHISHSSNLSRSPLQINLIYPYIILNSNNIWGIKHTYLLSSLNPIMFGVPNPTKLKTKCCCLRAIKNSFNSFSFLKPWAFYSSKLTAFCFKFGGIWYPK